MNEHIVDFSKAEPHGTAGISQAAGTLNIQITRAIHDAIYNIRRPLITSYVSMPGRYRLPLRIDMRARIDSPHMLVMVGDGHVSFGSFWMDNRRIEDILAPSGKPRVFDNSLPMGEYADISILYTLNEMRITVDGEERFYSRRERYMRADDAGERGLEVAVTASKRVNLSIKYMRICELNDDFSAERPEDAPAKFPIDYAPGAHVEGKPTFESCTALLPEQVKGEIRASEALVKSLPNTKFRRTIEKHGNKITYVAPDAGLSYALYLSGALMYQSIQWYIVTGGKPEAWARKDNPLDVVLAELDKSSPDLAERIFWGLNECVGCYAQCLARSKYTFRGKSKVTCHGKILFNMTAEDFRDARDLLVAVDSLRGRGLI